jgi:hypothetical protein
MKLAISLILSLVFAHSFAQNSFKMVFSSTGYDEGIRAFRTSSGEYRIVGNTAAYGQGGNEVWVIALDGSASFMWQKTYGTNQNDEAVDAYQSANGDIWITGNVTETNPPTMNVFALHINEEGVPIGQYTFGGPDWDFATSIHSLSDSTFVLCGYSYNGPQAGYVNPMTLAFDMHGDTLWTSYAGSAMQEVNSDVVTKDGQIFLSGYTVKNNLQADSAFVKSLDSSGQLLWYSVFPLFDGAFLSLDLFEDSLIALTGYHFDSTKSWREPMLASIEQNGKWVMMQDEAQGADSYFSDLTINDENQICIAGMSTQHTNGGEEIYAGTFDRWGWYKKANIIGGKEDDFPGSIAYESMDSTYLICGTTKSFGIPYSAIILTQIPNNSTLWYDTTMLYFLVSNMENQEMEQIGFTVFPNPASQFIYIKSDQYLSSPYQVELYSLEGKQLHSQRLNGIKTKSINISHLAKGYYYLTIRNNEQKITYPILKI